MHLEFVVLAEGCPERFHTCHDN